MSTARWDDRDAWHAEHAEAMRTGDYDRELAEIRARIDATTEAEWRVLQALREADEPPPEEWPADLQVIPEVSPEVDDEPQPWALGEQFAAEAARRLVDGAAFVLRRDTPPPPRWGHEDAVLWAEGEALMICAPPGVGKTTLGVQVVSAMCGIDAPEVLGLPVRPADRVLYLAMDRPKQIQRAMGRLWGPEHEEQLAERLVVWKGPLPFDLASDARVLSRLAEHAKADVVVLDSLKDAAVQLTDDRVAGMVNRAVQTCLAEGVDVLVLHHQRKGQNGEKPKRLEDVYGSTWITAGMGSVVLLWGQAGDPLVELVHLKQPAGEVGPWTVAHDHVAGRSTVYRGFDLDAFLILNPAGVTVMAVARAMTERASPTDTDRKKAQRLLDAAVKRGRLVKREGSKGGLGGSEAGTYHRVETDLVGGP